MAPTLFYMRSWLLSLLISAFVLKVHAAVIRSPDPLSEPDLPVNNITIIPASAPNNVAWPVEKAHPTLGPGSVTNSSISSPLAAPQLYCNGRSYGRNLNRASCIQINNVMSSYELPRTFGERGTGYYEANLPFRYLSRDGLCAVDISHTQGVDSDEIAPADLKRAARYIIDVCVTGSPNEGGLVTGLGKNGHLSMRVVPYKPTVECGPEGGGPPWMTCRDIIDAMPASNKKQVFGPKTEESTTVPIPWKYSTVRKRCGMFLSGPTDNPAASDTGDWYKIYAAATAVDFMCIQHGRRSVDV